jgi:hypothetical protein
MPWRRVHLGARTRRRSLRTLAAVALACLLLLSGFNGLQLHRWAAASLWRALRSPPRTNAALLLQHYAARELLFRRDAKRVYFLHIHKARCAASASTLGHHNAHERLCAGCWQHALPGGDGRGRAGEPRRQLQPGGRSQARAGSGAARGAVPRLPVRESTHALTPCACLACCAACFPCAHARGICAATRA